MKTKYQENEAMRTGHVTLGSIRSPREPSPRRFLRCGVARMVRSTAIPLLILAGMTLTPTEVGAGSITYNVVDYPTLQNGYTVSGTITTNGATGAALPGTDITAWDITITMGSTTIFTLTPSNSINFTSTFDATTTAITAATLSDRILFAQTAGVPFIQYENAEATIEYLAETLGQTLWINFTLPSASPVAAVPEPSSAVLASIGAIVAVLAYGWSRHRRVQRRQAAA
jgi:hypothetical protein